MKIGTLLAVLVVGVLQSVALAQEMSVDQLVDNVPTMSRLAPDTATYTGTLRIFLAEPTSRWNVGSGIPYRNGFLDFPVIDTIEIPPLGSWYASSTWDASATFLGSIDSGNITSVAAVHNSQGVVTDAYPPYQYYLFMAYYVDASATATIGQPGVGSYSGDYTHQVLVEASGSVG